MVAGTGSDFKNFSALGEAQRVGLERYGVGLRDGLARGNRKSNVLVSKLFKRTFEKGVAGNPPHGLKNALIFNAFASKQREQLLSLALVAGQIRSHRPKVQPYLCTECDGSKDFSTSLPGH